MRLSLTRMQIVSYVIIVAAMALGFMRLEARDDESCEDRIQTREAVRKVYRDVAELGRSLPDPADPERVQELILLFDQFERERLAEYPPIPPGCEG